MSGPEPDDRALLMRAFRRAATAPKTLQAISINDLSQQNKRFMASGKYNQYDYPWILNMS